MSRKAKDTKNLQLRGKTWWFRKSSSGTLHWFSLETTNLGTAQERRDRAIRDLEDGKWGNKVPRSFNDLAEKFASDHFPTIRPKSRKRYLDSLKHLLDAFDGLDLDQIGSAKMKDFELERRKAGVKTSTIRRDLACLSSMFSLAEEEEWIDRNPVKPFLRARSKRGLTEGEPHTRFLSHEEEAEILRHAPPKAAQAIAFAIDTGLRREEQFSLEWSDVDLDAGLVRIRAAIAKSSRQRRVPLLPRSKRLLERMAAERSEGIVFTTLDGQRYSPTSPTMYEALQKAVRRAGKDLDRAIDHVAWHDLRRTCGCRLLNDLGYEMHEVSVWLGHSSVTVTERHYAFLNAERLRDKLGHTQGQVAAATWRLLQGLNEPDLNQKPNVLALNSGIAQV